MSDTISPVSTANQNQGQRGMPVAGQSSVTATAPKGAESHAAVRPVDPSQQLRDARMDVLRDVPVGPPPSFDINVLQDIRAHQRDPDDLKDRTEIAADAVNEAAKDTAKDSAKGTGEARGETPTEPALYRQPQEADTQAQSLNRKV